jgi:hypothetical protein
MGRRILLSRLNFFVALAVSDWQSRVARESFIGICEHALIENAAAAGDETFVVAAGFAEAGGIRRFGVHRSGLERFKFVSAQFTTECHPDN